MLCRFNTSQKFIINNLQVTQINPLSQMFFYCDDKIRNHLSKPFSGFIIVLIKASVKLLCKIAGIIHHTSPQLSTLPPTDVGGVGTKHKEQTEHDPKKRVHGDGSLKI